MGENEWTRERRWPTKWRFRPPGAPRCAGCGMGQPALTFAFAGEKQGLGSLTRTFFARRRLKNGLGGVLGGRLGMP